jgi:hypothetical protein
MKKQMLFVLVCVLGLFTSSIAETTENLSESSPITFYESLIRDVKNAEGTVNVYFNDGKWVTKYQGLRVLWNIDPGTYALITFEYKGGAMEKLSIKFNTPIHVATVNKGSGCTSIEIKDLTYEYGNLVPPKIDIDTKVCKQKQLFELLQNFSINESFSDLLTGKLLQNTTSGIEVDSDENPTKSGRKMINSVSFQPLQGKPGLHAEFFPGAVINFSNGVKGSTYFNQIKLITGSFDFAKVTYYVANQYIKGRIINCDFTIENGTLSTSDFEINLSYGTTLDLANINFTHDSNESFVEISGGTCDGKLVRNSYLTIRKKDAIPDDIRFDDNTEAHLLSFSIEINFETKKTLIGIGNGSRFEVAIYSAHIGFGEDGYIDLSGGYVELRINNAIWENGKKPDVSAEIFNLDVTVQSGKLKFNPTNNLFISSGRLKGTNLDLNSLETPVLTGKFNEFDLNISDGSKFGAQNGLILETGAVSNIKSSNLELKPNVSYPVGDLHLNMSFKKFGSTDNYQLALTNGSFETDITNSEDGRMTGRGTVIQGDLKYDANFDPSPGILTLRVKIDEGSFNYRKGEISEFNGFIQGIGELKVSSDITTDGQNPQEPDNSRIKDPVFFPINLTLSINHKLTLDRTPITFNGVGVGMDLKFRFMAHVIFHEGQGEHNQRHNIGAGYNTGKGEIDKMQEIYVADVDLINPAGMCRLHAYIVPHERDFMFTLHIKSTTNNNQFITVDEIELLSPFEMDVHAKKDGCSGSEIGALWGVIVGSVGCLILSPLPVLNVIVNPVVLGVGGAVIGDNFEDNLVKSKMTMIADKINDYSRTWKMYR